MKKLILFLLLAIMIAGCTTRVDPHRYEGCLIIQKWDWPDFYFRVKLTPHLRDSLQTDYYTFYTEKYEWDKYEVGDTIR